MANKYWVLDKSGYKSVIDIEKDRIILNNGLIRRVVDLYNGTVSLKNIRTDKEYIKEVISDIELTIDGKIIEFYKEAVFIGYEIIPVTEDVRYRPTEYATTKMPYPPSGRAIKLQYVMGKILFDVIYEIYDGLPVICKRLYISNKTDTEIIINNYTLDKLSVTQENYDRFYGETNYNGGCSLNNNRTVSVDYNGETINIAFDIGPDAIVGKNEIFKGLRVYELLFEAAYYENRMIEVKEMYRIIAPWVLESPLIYHITSDSTYKVKRAVDSIKEVGFDMLIQSFGSGIKVESTNKRYIERHKKLYDYAHNKGIKIGGYTLAIVKNYRPIKSPECNPRPDKSRIMRCLATEWSEKYWRNIIDFYDKTGADVIEIDGPYHFYECDGGPTHLHSGLTDSKYMQWKLSNEDIFRKFKERNVYINTPDWMYLNGTNRSGIGYEEIAFSEPRQTQLLTSRIYNYKGSFIKIPSMAWSFLPISVYHGGGKAAQFKPLGKNIKDYEWSVFQHIISGIIPCFRGDKLYDDEKSKKMLVKWTSFYKKYKEVINGITVHFMPPRADKFNSARAEDIDCVLNLLPYGSIRGILGVFNQTDKFMKKSIKIPLFYANIVDIDFIPSPYKNSGITDVYHPVYGEYPPPYPVKSKDEIKESAKVTGYGSNNVIDENILRIDTERKIIGKVTLEKENGENIVADIDSNADIELDIEMQPMSYTYYIIKKDKEVRQ